MADSTTPHRPATRTSLRASRPRSTRSAPPRRRGLFDIRRLIGGLFLIYGVILVILGLGESDASIAKSADINVNLYSGLGMLALAAFFLAWGLLRPLGDDESED